MLVVNIVSIAERPDMLDMKFQRTSVKNLIECAFAVRLKTDIFVRL